MVRKSLPVARAMVMVDTTVAAISVNRVLTTCIRCSRITSRQPALAMIPAKENAQRIKRMVSCMEFMPPRHRSFSISGRIRDVSVPFTISMLNPLTDEANTSVKVNPW